MATPGPRSVSSGPDRTRAHPPRPAPCYLPRLRRSGSCGSLLLAPAPVMRIARMNARSDWTRRQWTRSCARRRAGLPLEYDVLVLSSGNDDVALLAGARFRCRRHLVAAVRKAREQQWSRRYGLQDHIALPVRDRHVDV